MARTDDEPVDQPEVRLAAPLGVMRRRIPELAVGVLFVGLGALGVLALTGSSDPPTEVLTLANDLTRDEVIAEDDLTTVALTADAPVHVVAAENREFFLGRRVATDLAAGSFITPEQLFESGVLPDGFAIVGMRLTAGAYPSTEFGAGDSVDVLALPTAGPSGAADADDDTGPPSAELLVGPVTVFSRQPLSLDPAPEMFVSLLVPLDSSGPVAAAAGTDRIWLAEVQP